MFATLKGLIINVCCPFCDPNVFDDIFFIIGIVTTTVTFFHLPTTPDQCVGCFVPNIFNFLLTFVADVAIAFDTIIAIIAVVGLIISHFVTTLVKDNFFVDMMYIWSPFFYAASFEEREDAVFNLHGAAFQSKRKRVKKNRGQPSNAFIILICV